VSRDLWVSARPGQRKQTCQADRTPRLVVWKLIAAKISSIFDAFLWAVVIMNWCRATACSSSSSSSSFDRNGLDLLVNVYPSCLWGQYRHTRCYRSLELSFLHSSARCNCLLTHKRQVYFSLPSVLSFKIHERNVILYGEFLEWSVLFWMICRSLYTDVF